MLQEVVEPVGVAAIDSVGEEAGEEGEGEGEEGGLGEAEGLVGEEDGEGEREVGGGACAGVEGGGGGGGDVEGGVEDGVLAEEGVAGFDVVAAQQVDEEAAGREGGVGSGARVRSRWRDGHDGAPLLLLLLLLMGTSAVDRETTEHTGATVETTTTTERSRGRRVSAGHGAEVVEAGEEDLGGAGAGAGDAEAEAVDGAEAGETGAFVFESDKREEVGVVPAEVAGAVDAGDGSQGRKEAVAEERSHESAGEVGDDLDGLVERQQAYGDSE